MHKYFLILGLLVTTLNAKSQIQDSLAGTQDTVNIKEVTISSNLPLDDNDIIDFYRTNHFETLDNINARLDGMSLIKRGAYALEPQLNGFSGGQLNVTIDGMKMFGACTDKMDPITSYIEPTNLKSIKISQGTNSCETGCNIGGSVDMTLQEYNSAANRTFYSSLGFGYASISQGKNILFSAGYNNKNWQFGLNGVYRKNENYKTGENNNVPFSQFQKINLHSFVKYNPSAINNFRVDVLFDEANNVGYPALPMDVGYARAVLLALDYRHSGNSQIKAKIYFNTIHHVMDDSKRDSLYFVENNETGNTDSVYMRMDMPGKSATLGSYFRINIPVNDIINLIIKADNYTNNSLAEMTMYMQYPGLPPEPPMYMQTWPEMLRNVSGLFVQNTSYLSQKLILMINGRIDYNVDILQSEYGQQQFSIFNYSLAKTETTLLKSVNFMVHYDLTKYFTIKASTGYAERMPTIGERLGFYLYNAYDGYDYIGNPYIKPENSKFAGIAFSLSTPRLKLNLDQSFSFVNNYIIGVNDSTIPPLNFYANGIRVYSNISSASLYSANLQVLWNPIDYISAFVISKITFGKFSSNEPMPLIPPFNNIISLKFEKKNLSMQAECETALQQNRINYNYGETITPAFAVFNLKGSYGFKWSKSEINFSIGITNLFNKTYYEHLDWGKIYRPGRSFELFLEFKY
ncbi:MAG: hypothetical protein U0W24_21895 [Bacteroidales bacterium]